MPAPVRPRRAAAAAVVVVVSAAAGCGGGDAGNAVRDPPPPYFAGQAGDLGVIVDFGGDDAARRAAAGALQAERRPTALAMVAIVNRGNRPRRAPVIVAATAGGRTVPLVDARTLIARLASPEGRRQARLVPPEPAVLRPRGSALAYLAAVDVHAAEVDAVQVIGAGRVVSLQRDDGVRPRTTEATAPRATGAR